MNQNIVKFYARLRNDEHLLEALNTCNSLDEAADLACVEARKLGFNFTKEEVLATDFDIQALHDAAANDHELNDFELELVAGGTQVKCNGGLSRV